MRHGEPEQRRNIEVPRNRNDMEMGMIDPAATIARVARSMLENQEYAAIEA